MDRNFAGFADLLAQVTLEGKVWSGKAPLPGASVYLQDTYDGTVTDFEGRFAFETDETGTWTLVVESRLDAPVASLDVELKEVYNEMQAATIQAGSFAAGEAHRTAVLRDIVAGANGNVVGALQPCPGPRLLESRAGCLCGAVLRTKPKFMWTACVCCSRTPRASNPGARTDPFLFSGTQSIFGRVWQRHERLETDRRNAVIFERKWENGGVLASLSYINLAPTMAAIHRIAGRCRSWGKSLRPGANCACWYKARCSTAFIVHAFASVVWTQPLNERWIVDAGTHRQQH